MNYTSRVYRNLSDAQTMDDVRRIVPLLMAKAKADLGHPITHFQVGGKINDEWKMWVITKYALTPIGQKLPFKEIGFGYMTDGAPRTSSVRLRLPEEQLEEMSKKEVIPETVAEPVAKVETIEPVIEGEIVDDVDEGWNDPLAMLEREIAKTSKMLAEVKARLALT